MSRRPLKYRMENSPAENGENGGGGDGGAGGIRGPNSALTEFLRQQGISAEQIRQRHMRRVARGQEGIPEEEVQGNGDGDGGDGEVEEPAETAEIEEEEGEEEDREELEMRIAARRKRRAASGKKDDDDEYTDSEVDEDGYDNDGDDEDGVRGRKVVGDEETCASCGDKFVINVYSKTSDGGGYLCTECTQRQLEKERAIKRNQLLSRKKRQKLAVALLNREDVKLPTLQDLAIKKVTERIYEVEELGDIGIVNMKKISKILCRNRSLDDNTIKLFLDSNLENLEFWDCSGLSSNAYFQIGSYCPNLCNLTLLMCGKFHNDNLNYFGLNLTRLKKIELDGPFLINNETWREFFNKIGDRLESFKLSHTHRFDDETLKLFLEKCGGNLKELKLSRLDGIKKKESYDLMPVYLTQLEKLEISYPTQEELVDDSLIINLLSINGCNLENLILDGCSGLTDEFLINGIKPFGGELRKLSLCQLDQITSEGFVGLFHDWKINLGLNEVFLTKCFSLGDEGIIEMILHSGNSIVELSLNSIKDLSPLSFQIMKCPNLTYLDGGFVRCIDDDVLELIGENCPQLRVLDCYGNNRCTSRAKIRDGLKVIGRQSDTV